MKDLMALILLRVCPRVTQSLSTAAVENGVAGKVVRAPTLFLADDPAASGFVIASFRRM
jgi:hypothetical protein